MHVPCNGKKFGEEAELAETGELTREIHEIC